MFNTKIMSFLSSDVLESMEKELQYYLPEIIGEGLEKEFCATIQEIRVLLADENRQESKD